MSDRSLKQTKNKKNKVASQRHRHSTASAGDPPSKSLSIAFLWLPALVSIAVYVYLNPATLKNIVNEWIGFSEHFDATPTVQQPAALTITTDMERRDAIVAAFKHSWKAYVRDAMGDDEYHPIAQRGSNLTHAGGIGYMVVDVLDTMQIMDLKDEYRHARQWVAEKLSFDRDGKFSTFETTIRVLGGLLSAYHLSGGDELYLQKARDLADRIMPVFDTPVGIPLPIVNLAQRKGYQTEDMPGMNSIAEIATLQLEFRYLSQITGDNDYWKAAVKVMQIIRENRLPHGLASAFVRIDNGQYEPTVIRLGSLADSYYEYLLKQYLQTNNTEGVYREMYAVAMDGIHANLIQKSTGSGLTYTSELVPEEASNGAISWRLTPRQDHLVCFLGGSLMLGAVNTGTLKRSVSMPPRLDEFSEKGKRDWKTGVELIRTCMNMHDTATGLAPETVYFRVRSDGMDDTLPNALKTGISWARRDASESPPYGARYMLRPETVESLFLAYRLTGEQRYRDHGWRIFQSIEKHCRVESGGYATIINVDENPSRREDKMETFFLSETLKYLYLLFSSSDVVPLNNYVFNTEAHPFPIFQAGQGPN